MRSNPVAANAQVVRIVVATTCGLLINSALLCSGAYAQEAAAGGSDQLVEIVVTAQRREQNLQDVPIAVGAFNAQELKASGVTTVGELALVDPSLSIPRVVGLYEPFLRGIGNSAAGSVGNESSVPVYIDDVYYTRLSTAYLALGSIDRVEVLKGPQGTLFGRNSSGGAIQMFTKDPGQKPELEATLGYANYRTSSAQFYASTPITDTLAWNIAAGGSDQRSGWGRSITTGQDVNLEKDGTVRSKLIWDPGTGTRVKLVGFYAYSRGDIGIPEDRHRGTYGGSAALPLPGYPVPPVALQSLGDTPGGFYNTRNNFIPTAREQGYGGSLRIDQDIWFADLVSISAFRNSTGLISQDGDLSAQNFENAYLYDIDRQFTQEFQVKSKAGSRIEWIVGAFYMHSKAGYEPTVVSGDIVDVAIAPGATEDIYSRQTVNSYSLYTQATMPIAAKTNLTLGLRDTDDQLKGSGQTNATIPGVGEFPAGPLFTDSKIFNRVTGKVAIDHHFTDDIMSYVSATRGYKAGTFNTLPLNGLPALPETVNAYEIGAKSELADHRIRVNGALFWNDIQNPQVLTVIEQGLTSGIGLTNAQKARVKGAELGFDAIVAKGLNLRGAATYLDGTYLKFTDAPFYSENGTTIVGPVLGDASGHRLPNVPHWRLDAGANYAFNTAPGEWVGDVSVGYASRFAWTPDNTVFEKEVTLVNASLSFTPASLSSLTFGVWVKNLGDVKYYASTQESTGPLGTGGWQSSAAPPRTFGGTVSVKF